MTDTDDRLTMLLAPPERGPDVAFANSVALAILADRRMRAAARADRRRTVHAVLATASVAAGLAVLATAPGFIAFAAMTPFGDAVLLLALMLLWFAVQARGTLADD